VTHRRSRRASMASTGPCQPRAPWHAHAGRIEPRISIRFNVRKKPVP
jgi:hypothetical protein